MTPEPAERWPQLRPSNEGSVIALRVSPDGRYLLAELTGDRVRLWDLLTRQPAAQWCDTEPLFGAEPGTVLTGPYAALRRYDVATGGVETRPWPRPQGHLLAGPGGAPWYLVTDPAAGPCLLDVASGTVRCRLVGADGDLGVGELSPDGRWLVTRPSGGHEPVRVWSVPDGVLRRELPGDDYVWAAVPLPGRDACVVGGASGVEVWDVGTGELLVELDGEELAVSPDGALLAVAEERTLRIYDTRRWEQRVEIEAPATVEALAFTPDGRLLATGDDEDTVVRLWDTTTGLAAYELAGATREVHALAFSPDGRLLATVVEDDPAVRVWETATGRLLHRFGPHAGEVHAVAFSPAVALLAVADDETVRFWNVAGGSPAGALPPTGAATFALAYPPDGGRLATTGADGTIRVWDVTGRTPPRVLAGHRNPVWFAAFSPDGRYLVVADDEAVCAWDTATGAFVNRLADMDGLVDVVAVAPDGRRFAVASSADGARTLSVYPAPWTEPAQRHMWADVHALAFSPAGPLAVADDSDGDVTVHLGAGVDGDSRTLDGHAGLVRSLAWSPDGRLLAAGTADAAVHLWDAAAGRRLAVLVALDDGGSATLRGGGAEVVGGAAGGEFRYPPAWQPPGA